MSCFNNCNCYKCTLRKLNDEYQIELIENEGIVNKIKEIKEIINSFKNTIKSQSIKEFIQLEIDTLNNSYYINKKYSQKNKLECLLEYFLDLKNIYERRLFCESLL